MPIKWLVLYRICVVKSSVGVYPSDEMKFFDVFMPPLRYSARKAVACCVVAYSIGHLLRTIFFSKMSGSFCSKGLLRTKTLRTKCI